MELGADLRGKTVLVTGASSGLGAHFAQVFAREGCRLVLAARRIDRLMQAVAPLKALGAPAVLAIDLDVTSDAAIRRAFETLADAFGLPDVVVNNAGSTTVKAALELPISEFDQVLAVNLRGVFLVAAEAARRWVAANRQGAIINIASILGFRVTGHQAHYAASKAGVVQLTRSLALEWARYGIRVNALAPGYFETEINAGYFETEAGQTMLKRIPMRRTGRLAELDAPLLLLASQAGSYMTGETIAIDGGHLVSTL